MYQIVRQFKETGAHGRRQRASVHTEVVAATREEIEVELKVYVI
jgi:hypothetical protein